MTDTTSDTPPAFVLPHHPLREALTGSVASIAFTFIAVIAVGLLWIGPKFISFGNVSIMGTFLIVPLIVGAFSGFALLAGVVDLSIGSIVGISAAIFAYLISHGWGVWPAAGTTLGICLVIGALNALAIVRFAADPIAATLGMLTALRGITTWTGTLNSRPAHAYAAAALPALKVIRPRRCTSASPKCSTMCVTRFNMPRTLYEPVRCRCSDFNRMRPSPRSGPPLRRSASAAPMELRSGVTWSRPAVRAAARFTAARSMVNGSPVSASRVGSRGAAGRVSGMHER